MPKMQQLVLMAALLAFTALCMPCSAGAAGFNQFLIFGDSTLDTGYFANTPGGETSFDDQMQVALHRGLTGGFAGDGTMNTIMLAERFGLTAAPINTPAGGGTNYANGGATTVVNHESMVPNNICTLSQIEIYLASVHGVANPRLCI
jgi:outer membrane lipase/esterase